MAVDVPTPTPVLLPVDKSPTSVQLDPSQFSVTRVAEGVPTYPLATSAAVLVPVVELLDLKGRNRLKMPVESILKI